MAVIGLVNPPSGVRPLNVSTFMFANGAIGGRRVYPLLIRNCDCGTVAIGIN